MRKPDRAFSLSRFNDAGDEYGIERVKSWLNAAPQRLSAQELYESLSRELARFRGQKPLRDDCAILVVKRR